MQSVSTEQTAHTVSNANVPKQCPPYRHHTEGRRISSNSAVFCSQACPVFAFLIPPFPHSSHYRTCPVVRTGSTDAPAWTTVLWSRTWIRTQFATTAKSQKNKTSKKTKTMYDMACGAVPYRWSPTKMTKQIKTRSCKHRRFVKIVGDKAEPHAKKGGLNFLLFFS